MGIGIMETQNPPHKPMNCISEANSQERDSRTSLAEEGAGNVEYRPFFMPGLAWPDTCPQAAVRSTLIFLFTGELKGEAGGLSC